MTNERLVHGNGALGGQTKINVQLVHGNGPFGGQTKDNDEGYQKHHSRNSTIAEGNGSDKVAVLR